MTWNFCPWCSHRTYQHNDKGCEHVDRPYRPCTDPECTDREPNRHEHGHYVDEPCDCKHGHPLLVQELQ